MSNIGLLREDIVKLVRAQRLIGEVERRHHGNTAAYLDYAGQEIDAAAGEIKAQLAALDRHDGGEAGGER